MFTAPEASLLGRVGDLGCRMRGNRWKEWLGDLRGGKEANVNETPARTLGCFEDAVKEAGERRQTNGVLGLERGRVSFLVYRID